MIRGINKARFFIRSLYLQERCQIVASSVSVSTSSSCQGKQREVSKSLKEDRDFLEMKKEFLERDRKRYEDTFGNIENFERMFQRIKDDPEDIKEYEELKAAPGKTLRQYINEIKALLRENDYKAAVKLLEVDMRNDRIRDTSFVYRMLLSHNGLLGDLEEAYRLFLDYKKRGGVVPGSMYTSLFNACANCKNSTLALEKIESLRECMGRNKFHKANLSNYNAMMKAYGRHRHMSACLKLMDEVLENRGHVNSSTYSFLLQACISDPNSGLRHALLIWRKMLQNLTKPSLFCFNLMLRCVRDCSLGEVVLIPDAMKQILDESKHFYKRRIKIKKTETEEKRRLLKIPADGRKLLTSVETKPETQEQPKQTPIDLGSVEASNVIEQPTSESVTVENQTESQLSISEVKDNLNVKKSPSQGDYELPNLLALEPTMGSVVEFSGMTSKEDRFVLVGGVEGVLKTMAEFGVKPDVKTFTLMLDLIPPTVEAEEKLISVAESNGLEIDVGFYNALLRKRVFRGEKYLITDCLDQMRARNLKPDIITFGILGFSCTTHELGIELIENLHSHGFRLNPCILYALLACADNAGDMKYLLTVLRAAKEDDVKLTPKCFAKISRIVKYRERSLERERREAEAAMSLPPEV